MNDEIDQTDDKKEPKITNILEDLYCIRLDNSDIYLKDLLDKLKNSE